MTVDNFIGNLTTVTKNEDLALYIFLLMQRETIESEAKTKIPLSINRTQLVKTLLGLFDNSKLLHNGIAGIVEISLLGDKEALWSLDDVLNSIPNRLQEAGFTIKTNQEQSNKPALCFIQNSVEPTEEGFAFSCIITVPTGTGIEDDKTKMLDIFSMIARTYNFGYRIDWLV